jgi:hypothetical protein
MQSVCHIKKLMQLLELHLKLTDKEQILIPAQKRLT